MNSNSEKAKSYSEALKLGAVKLEEIIQWADSVIGEEDEPSIEIIELSLCKKKSDALTYLECLSSSADEEQSYRILFGILHCALRQEHASYSEVAKRLYFWSAYETSLKGYGELTRFWDALDLAESGTYGDPVVVKKEILDFLCEKMA